MKNVIQAATVAAQLSAHRRAIMDTLVGHPLILTAEYDTAMQRTLACQDLATLQKWYRNTIREIARREEQEPVTAPVTYATAAQVEEVQKLTNHVTISRAEKTAALRKLPALTTAEVTAEIGNLWAKIISRAGEKPLPDGWSLRPEVSRSYSSAA